MRFGLKRMILDDSEEYLLYPDLCFIPSDYDELNVAVGNTTRTVCRKLCSDAYSRDCSGFLYDRQSHSCKLTPFTGELVEGDDEVSTLRRGCNQSTFEFYRRIRRLSMYSNRCVQIFTVVLNETKPSRHCETETKIVGVHIDPETKIFAWRPLPKFD